MWKIVFLPRAFLISELGRYDPPTHGGMDRILSQKSLFDTRLAILAILQGLVATPVRRRRNMYPIVMTRTAMAASRPSATRRGTPDLRNPIAQTTPVGDCTMGFILAVPPHSLENSRRMTSLDIGTRVVDMALSRKLRNGSASL